MSPCLSQINIKKGSKLTQLFERLWRSGFRYVTQSLRKRPCQKPPFPAQTVKKIGLEIEIHHAKQIHWSHSPCYALIFIERKIKIEETQCAPWLYISIFDSTIIKKQKLWKAQSENFLSHVTILTETSDSKFKVSHFQQRTLNLSNGNECVRR